MKQSVVSFDDFIQGFEDRYNSHELRIMRLAHTGVLETLKKNESSALPMKTVLQDQISSLIFELFISQCYRSNSLYNAKWITETLSKGMVYFEVPSNTPGFEPSL